MKLKKFTAAALLALFGMAVLAPSIAEAAPPHKHKVCKWKHHHKVCRWVR